MALSCKYSIQDINNIIFNGFEYKLDEGIIEVISNLTSEVGSPTYIKTPNFQKQNTNVDDNKGVYSKNMNKNGKNMMNENYNKRKKNNKNNESVKDDDWETIRTFSTTKIEQHEGIDIIIDTIRSNLNKMSIKTYDEINNNVNNTIDLLLKENINKDELIKIGNIIFDIVSSNRFYSKLYADLYSILISKYEFLNDIFKEKVNTFTDVLNTVEYVSPDDNYDLFCKINNDNEKRKALTAFIVNLAICKVINVSKIEELLLELLEKVDNLIKEDNKKFIVDEYVELIFILYDKELFSLSEVNVENNEKILTNIKFLASVKVKTYPSLSSKSIFKLMDIIDM
jgi:hypothetical protein